MNINYNLSGKKFIDFGTFWQHNKWLMHTEEFPPVGHGVILLSLKPMTFRTRVCSFSEFLHFSIKLSVCSCLCCSFCFHWWLVRVTLVVAWWLFAPKFWEVVGTYESLFCSKMNAASVVVACEVVGTLNHYKMVKKNFELCALRGGGDIKTFWLSLAP